MIGAADKTTPQKLTVPEAAERLRVGEDKIRNWIAAGELRAINIATRRGGRPRWRIDLADLLAFEARRSAVPGQASTTRRRRSSAAGVIEYF